MASLLTPTISSDPAPALVTALWSTPSSRARISITLGEQKPPWHRPIPARTRRFTPSTLRAPGTRRMASMISPSVTVSHRQMTAP